MKKMTNDYFLKFCDIVERSMPDPSQFDNCRKDMIDASFDDRNEVFVYTDTSHNMEVLKLDEYTKEFEKRRRNEIPNLKEHQPSAVDAVCVSKDNEWFLIEFKNEPIKNIHEGITLQYFFPEVVRCIAVGIVGVACTAADTCTV